MEELVTAKRKKNPLPIIIAVIAVAILGALAIVLIANSKSARVNRHFDAIEKYMDELDYTNAVAEYKAIIKIDPKNVKAYLGLAEVYLAMDDIGSAISVLEDGYTETESDAIKDMLNEMLILQENRQQSAQENQRKDPQNDEVTDDGDEKAYKYLDAAAQIGDVVAFGTDDYPNEWIVLDKDGGKILLISKDAVAFKKFHEEEAIVTWETCSLRTWLNNEYLYAAFSDDERAIIQSSVVVTNDNEYSGRSGGAATDDYIFLLSLEEACKYFVTDKDRILICDGVYEFTDENGSVVEVLVDNEVAIWWLRTPGNGDYGTTFVDNDGTAVNRQSWVNNEKQAVRPAMWVDVSNL